MRSNVIYRVDPWVKGDMCYRIGGYKFGTHEEAAEFLPSLRGQGGARIVKITQEVLYEDFPGGFLPDAS